MKFLAVLGRLPEISLAEIEALYGETILTAPNLATFENDEPPEIDRLGGTMKLARLLDVAPLEFLQSLPSGKITLGLSDYSTRASVANVRREAMRLKKILSRHGRSVRALDNKQAVLSTATVLHNGLGRKERAVELILVNKDWYVGVGVQDIEAYTRRDQARPARDAKVGMLPPKLAQILINLCGPLPAGARVLDPFCGTGVVLQEAYLMGYTPYGTDASERMVEYSQKNLAWLTETDKCFYRDASGAPVFTGRQRSGSVATCAKPSKNTYSVSVGDATSFTWEQPVDAVACETYLGPPMSQPPVDIKLKTVKAECGEIISGFLKNIAPQLKSGVPLVLAVPAWRRPNGSYSRLDLLDKIEEMGYNVLKRNSGSDNLLYYRDGQVVAREIIVLRKK
ncbi:hypothetical protein IKF76_01585 [Candidatus Saccharibacteria bacterium]|nr:hypothetical protein [Candidatus Saccharibacteria bacterium]